MTERGTCGLCGRPEGAKMVRLYALDICEACRGGHAVEGVNGPRLTVLIGRHRSASTSRNAPTYWHVTATGRWPAPQHLVLAPEGLVTAIKSLFVDELQAGDPLFDDNVWIDTHDPVGTKRVLAIEGAQAAILTLVHHGRVELAPGELRSLSRAEGTDEPPYEQVLAVCALARLLQRTREKRPQ